MAMRDWNGDGKKDFVDNIIEYQIYENVMDDDKDKPNISVSNVKKSHVFDNKATTTDGKQIDGCDINGWTLLLGGIMAILAWVFIIKSFIATMNDEIAISFLFAILGIAFALFGKWFFLGKNIIKQEQHKKYNIEEQLDDNDHQKH